MEREPTATTEGLPLKTLYEKYFVRIVLLLTAIVFAGTLRFDFVYDDFPQILFNPFIRAWHFVPQYFVSSVGKQMSPFAPGNYYRPLFLVLLRASYSVFAKGPLGWHLVALVLHLLVTWLVYVLVKRMTGQFTLAWLSALIFGVHPIHHEVIAWVSATTESLFAIMFLAAFLAYLQSREKARPFWTAVSCSLYVLALLSKETGIVLPLLVFAYDWIGYAPAQGEPRPEYARRFKSSFGAAAVYLPIAFLYLFVRNRILAGLGHSLAPVSFGTWLLTLPSILVFYLRHWFFPVGLSESYDLFYQPNWSLVHVLLPLSVLAVLGAAIWILRKRMDAKTVGYAMAWMVIPLLPALDTFVFRADELVHDRYFYVPSIGASLLIALIIERAGKTRRGLFGQPFHVVGAGFALAVILAFLAARATSFWVDDYTLFSRAHQIAPWNGTAMTNLAAELIDRNDLSGAETILEMGYRNDPTDFRFAFNLGRLLYRKGRYPEADAYIRQTMKLYPDLGDAYVYLGEIQLKQDHPAEAQRSLRRAVELNPYSAPFHTSYGIILALNGDCATAAQQFEAALALNPGEGLTELQLARCRAATSPARPAASKPGQL